jgi:LacI family transcriptional regulator
MVVGQIHRSETGIPLFPRATLIGASWIDGESVEKQIPKKAVR